MVVGEKTASNGSKTDFYQLQIFGNTLYLVFFGDILFFSNHFKGFNFTLHQSLSNKASYKFSKKQSISGQLSALLN